MQTLTDMALVILQDELTITETSAENEAKPKQGPQSNFEIWGGGGGISDSILGGTRQFFLLNLYNFKNIGGARAPPAHPPTPPPPRAPTPRSLPFSLGFAIWRILQHITRRQRFICSKRDIHLLNGRYSFCEFLSEVELRGNAGTKRHCFSRGWGGVTS